MYKRILVAVEHSPADRTIVTHVTALAKLTGAELLLVHVADGFAARNFDRLKLRESEEMKADRAYLEGLRADLAAQGLDVSTQLALGDPAQELIRAADDGKVDLIAMSTHGHRFLSDVIHGATADRVRHLVKIPVLLLRAQRSANTAVAGSGNSPIREARRGEARRGEHEARRGAALRTFPELILLAVTESKGVESPPPLS